MKNNLYFDEVVRSFMNVYLSEKKITDPIKIYDLRLDMLNEFYSWLLDVLKTDDFNNIEAMKNNVDSLKKM